MQPALGADNSAVFVMPNVKVRIKPSIPAPSESSWLVMVKCHLLTIEIVLNY